MPIDKKRTHTKFELMVKYSLSKVSKHICCRFSTKAREYMLTYHHKKIMDDDGMMDKKYRVVWSFGDIKRIQKVYRSHHDVNCIDGRYIEMVLRDSVGIKIEKDV